MKANINNQPFVPNKKLIIHFDVENVLKISHSNKDLFVYELCSQWVWGKLQKNSKEDTEKVSGWKIAQNNLSIEQPEQDLVTYYEYLQNYLKPSEQERQKLILNLSKGPASKAKAEIEKNIKNISLPKTLYETLKQTKQQNESAQLRNLLDKYTQSAKYEILPAFFKFIMWLKKSKKQFALIIKNTNINDNHQSIIDQLNLFFTGEHPLFNGKNGTPQIKFDGSKGCKNFIIDNDHQTVLYEFSDGEYFSSYGTLNVQTQKDVEHFKQSYKSLKQVRLCQGSSDIYAHSHAILSQSGCIYEINSQHAIFIDPVDYLTHQIYFTNSSSFRIESCLNERVNNFDSHVVQVNMFDYLRDVDYFVKNTELLEKKRNDQIQRIEKGDQNLIQQHQQEKGEENNVEVKSRESDSEYLKRTILPVLQGAMKQVLLLRPQDPLGYLALLCLKNKDRVRVSR